MYYRGGGLSAFGRRYRGRHALGDVPAGLGADLQLATAPGAPVPPAGFTVTNAGYTLVVPPATTWDAAQWAYMAEWARRTLPAGNVIRNGLMQLASMVANGAPVPLDYATVTSWLGTIWAGEPSGVTSRITGVYSGGTVDAPTGFTPTPESEPMPAPMPAAPTAPPPPAPAPTLSVTKVKPAPDGSVVTTVLPSEPAPVVLPDTTAGTTAPRASLTYQTVASGVKAEGVEQAAAAGKTPGGGGGTAALALASLGLLFFLPGRGR